MVTLTKQHMKIMEIPEGFYRSKLALVPETVKPQIERFVNYQDQILKKGYGIILSGESGVGKSSIGSCILKHYRANEHPGLFVSAADLHEYEKKQVVYEGNISYLERARSVTILVLDDLSAEDTKDQWYFTSKKLADLLSFRKYNLRPTIITTRLTKDRFMNLFSQAWQIAQGYLVWIEVTGQDQRQKEQEAAEKLILGK